MGDLGLPHLLYVLIDCVFLYVWNVVCMFSYDRECVCVCGGFFTTIQVTACTSGNGYLAVRCVVSPLHFEGVGMEQCHGSHGNKGLNDAIGAMTKTRPLCVVCVCVLFLEQPSAVGAGGSPGGTVGGDRCLLKSADRLCRSMECIPSV